MHVSPSVAPYDVTRIAQKSVKLSEAEKIQFLDNYRQPAASSALDTQRVIARHRKKVILLLSFVSWQRVSLYLKEHLISEPQIARYTSKTVENEVIGFIADTIREYFRKCLEKNPHFSLIADETTFEGREVFSVCLRLLDLIAILCNQIKREVLIDMCDLTKNDWFSYCYCNHKQKHAIDIRNCRG